MNTSEISNRYNELASGSCNLSCGGNIDFVNPCEGEVCLDLGCGRGNELMELALAVGNTGLAIGIDVSAGMIEKACQRAKELNLNNVKLICQDLKTLPLADASIDAVISNCVLNHIADKPLIWNEISRVMKKGSRFVISDIYSLNEIPEPWCSDPVSIAECWAGALTKDKYLKILFEAGFADIQILKELKPYKKGVADIVSFTIKGLK